MRKTQERGIIDFAVPLVIGGEFGGGDGTLEIRGGEGTLEREAMLDLCCCRIGSGDWTSFLVSISCQRLILELDVAVQK